MSTQLSAVAIALGVVLTLAVVLVRRGRVRRPMGANPEKRCRRDIQALRRGSRTQSTEFGSDDVWSAGTASDSAYSRSTKAVAWVAMGSIGGCGGCGGCGCGG